MDILEHTDEIRETIKKENKKNIKIVLCILGAILLISILLLGYQYFIKGGKIGYVSLNPIDITLSAEDGEHKLSVDVTLGGKSRELNKLNLDNVQVIVKETIKNLDYNEVVKENGTEYIKQTILDRLKSEYGDKIESINLESIITDVNLGPNTQGGDEDKVSDLLENFGWEKKN